MGPGGDCGAIGFGLAPTLPLLDDDLALICCSNTNRYSSFFRRSMATRSKSVCMFDSLEPRCDWGGLSGLDALVAFPEERAAAS